MDLKPLCLRIADQLGIEPLDIKFEDLNDDSRLYIKENYVAINKKYEMFIFQIFYVNLFSNERSKRWKKELQGVINSSNMDSNGSNYIAQEIELDAFAFTKYYLENYESIPVINKVPGYDEFIDKYLHINHKIM